MGDFIASWPLFHDAYIGGILASALLALLGIQLVARDQIFFGAAIAQASTFGISVALVTAAWHPFGIHLHHFSWYPPLCAAICAVAAAVGIECVTRREIREAATAFVFLTASAGALVLLTNSPHGMEEVQHLLASSLLGATARDGLILGILLTSTSIFLLLHGDRLLLIAIDPGTADAAGLGVRRWSLGFVIWCALCVGMAIRMAGLLFTFGNLLLPTLAARQVVRDMRPLFWIAPLMAAGSTLAGAALAHTLDVPPAQMGVLLQGVLIAILWALGRLRQ